MKDNKTLALVGAALLFLGAFMPILSVPIVGSLNYFQNGRGDGVIMVILAAVTALLAMTGRTRDVLWTGLASIAMLGFTFVRLQSALGDMRSKIETDLADNPFRGLADMAVGLGRVAAGRGHHDVCGLAGAPDAVCLRHCKGVMSGECNS